MSISRSTALETALKARAELDTYITTLQASTPNDAPAPPNRVVLLGRLYDTIYHLHGPQEYAVELILGNHDRAALSVLYRYAILRLLPGTTKEVAKKAGLEGLEDELERCLKVARTLRVVEEVQPGQWGRTELGQVFLDDNFEQAAYLMGSEWLSTDAGLCGYLEEKRKGSGLTSPYQFVRGKTLWEELQSDADYSRRFSRMAQGLGAGKIDDTLPMLTSFIEAARSSLSSNETGIFIDCGGGNGYILSALAPIFPDIAFEVQDISELQFGTSSYSNLSYKVHDFFEPQPSHAPHSVLGFMIRRSLHNWKDDDVVKILQSFVPAMEMNPKTRFLINETVLPETGEWERWQELAARRIDINMMCKLSAKERSLKEWERIVERVDERLVVEEVRMEKSEILGATGCALVVLKLAV